MFTGVKSIIGSVDGNVKETQEMLDFAAEHDMSANVEIIPIEYINTAMELLDKDDVRYRFVVDVENTLTPPTEL